jgi:hypothetical protein
MPFPTVKTGRVDKVVTNILLAHKNNEFIVDKILPVVPGLKDDSGIIPELENSGLRIYSSRRALYDEGQHRIEFKYLLDREYKIEYHDLESYLPDRLVEQAEKPFMPRRDAAFILDQALMLERERGLAQALTSVSIITNNITLSGTDQWNDYDNSHPESDIEVARDSVFNNTNMEANTAVMSRRVMNVLKFHPFFLDLAKRNAGGSVKNITTDQFIDLFKAQFGIENVFIGKARYISSMEGQTKTMANVWNNDLVLMYVPSSPTLMSPSFGYSFQLAGQNKRVTTRRHENDKGDLVREDYAYQDLILMAEGAYLIKAATSDS